MIFITILCYCLTIGITLSGGFDLDKKREYENEKPPRCLSGYMTDLQSWVDEDGELITSADINGTIDISATNNVVKRLREKLSSSQISGSRGIKVLSLAKCRLTRIPTVFKIEDSFGRSLARTVEYVTFFGNNFGTFGEEGERYTAKINATHSHELPVDVQLQRKWLTAWSLGFQGNTFSKLRELDLRSCSIRALDSNAFRRMPELRRLYLSENNINYIDANAFKQLVNLKHLDMSRNYAYDGNGIPKDLAFDTADVFEGLNLESLDFSYTKLGTRNIPILTRLGKSLKSLSLCYSGLSKLRDDAFNFTSLRYLDISGNNEVFASANVLKGLEKSLKVLYAEEVTLRTLFYFENFSNLEILKLTNNEIATIPPHVTSSLKKLQILDLDNNRITSWFTNVMSKMEKLKLLILRNNNINIVTKEMAIDIENISYIGLSGNYLVCNCYVREIYEVALKNERYKKEKLITELKYGTHDTDVLFHTGFHDYNKIIQGRRKMTSPNGDNIDDNTSIDIDTGGNYVLLDYDESFNMYKCLLATEGKSAAVFEVPTCSQSIREFDLPEEIREEWNRIFLLIIPVLLLPLVLSGYVFRKNFRYFLIMVRNSAMLSMINKNVVSDDSAIFNYDVFVSYCNEDRAWVLDQLLPHVEKDCSISVCLHERDFQVGLSILENIVSCMDRSRSIMLIISKRFLLSQWCQFEMHLAQHRLLETRREDLILILLEEIPRRLRPNTLHYLMLTKTYIVWPQEESEQGVFWRRMKKSLVMQKLRNTDNVSLA